MNSILVIYEQWENCARIVQVLKDYGYQVYQTQGSLQGIEILRKQKKFSFAILDAALKDIEPLSMIVQLRALDICLPLLYLAKNDVTEKELKAVLEAGANDFLRQNASMMRIAGVARNLQLYLPLELEYDFRARLKGKRLFSTLVAKSDAMRNCIKLASNATKASKHIFLRGEQGTGREDLARAIHENSNFKTGNFVVLQCLDYFKARYENNIFEEAILTQPCLEKAREGFYHNLFYSDIYPDPEDNRAEAIKQNAHSGAMIPKISGPIIERGYFNQLEDWASYAKKQLFFAQKGTLCLLNFEALTKGQQTILESLLADYFQKKRKLFRIITITTISADELVKEHHFSVSLVKKLSEIQINVPPLRQRREDLPKLSANILREMTLSLGRLHHIQGVSGAVLVSLMQQSWNGNIPQLENILYRAALSSAGPLITLKDLAQISPNYSQWGVNPNVTRDNETTSSASYLDEDGHVKTLALVEQELIEVALKRYQYRMSEVSRRLDIGRSTLYRKIEEYDAKARRLAKKG